MHHAGAAVHSPEKWKEKVKRERTHRWAALAVRGPAWRLAFSAAPGKRGGTHGEKEEKAK
jgi:hypothetical protein